MFESMLNPQEQLNCLARLSVAIRFKMLYGSVKLLRPSPSYTITLARPGAIDTAISMSSDTSSAAEPAAPVAVSISTLTSGTLGRWACAS